MQIPFPAPRTGTPCDLVRLYDRLAPRYDHLHRRWLRYAGQGAQTALEASVRSLAAPGHRLLDAGCGTGAFARRLQAETLPQMALTLLDPSPHMLSFCADIDAERHLGRLEAMPFPDSRFDLVTCAWALETVPDVDQALREMCRVLRPGGALCLVFCADRQDVTFREKTMTLALSRRGSGRFLSPPAVARTLADRRDMRVRFLPCSGPATALVAFRARHP